jgi:BRCT domain type II-containing protein
MTRKQVKAAPELLDAAESLLNCILLEGTQLDYYSAVRRLQRAVNASREGSEVIQPEQLRGIGIIFDTDLKTE